MRKLWRLVVRVVFWSYERGSLPYDLMVIAILLFVLLTPRKWYHDQPNVSPPSAVGRIHPILSQDPDDKTQIYRLDASLLKQSMQAAELEQQAHALLSRNVPSLHDRTFQIVQIQTVRGDDGRVAGYEVCVKTPR